MIPTCDPMRDLPVRWGLSLPNRGVLFGLTSVAEILDAARFAEESEVFESVWVGDSFIHKPRLESIVMLSALAAQTRKVRLGTICMATFPLRHPVELALQWASLDQLSNGRTVLGACNGGGYGAELDVFGVAAKERVARVEEGIALLRSLWDDTEVHHRGRFYCVDGINLVPKPVQTPCPIWIAVNPRTSIESDARVPRALERVVRLADGYMTDAVPPEEFRRRWAFMQELAERQGKDLSHFETTIHGMININEDSRIAYDESRHYFSEYYTPAWPTKEVIDIWLAYGPPDVCAARLREWLEMGISTPVLRFTSRDQLGQIRRFVDDVLPLI